MKTFLMTALLVCAPTALYAGEVIQDPMRLACAGMAGHDPGLDVCEEVAKHPTQVTVVDTPMSGVSRDEYQALQQELAQIQSRIAALSEQLTRHSDAR